MKNLPKWMTTVTPASKIIAAVLFISLPFAGFFLGASLPKINTESPTGNNLSVVYTKTPVITIPISTAPVTTTIASTSTVSDPYVGWKTYTSTDYDISFKYPSNWQITTDTQPFNCTSSVTLSDPSKCNETTRSTNIYIKFNTNISQPDVVRIEVTSFGKGCESCSVKEYPLNFETRKGLHGDYIFYLGSLNNKPNNGFISEKYDSQKSISGFPTGENSLFSRLYLMYSASTSTSQTDIDNLIKVLNSMK